MIVTKRHFADYFDITAVELQAVNDLLRVKSKELRVYDQQILGFKIEVNSGRIGESVHCHIHLIPKRAEYLLLDEVASNKPGYNE